MGFQLESPFIDDYLASSGIIDYEKPRITTLLKTLHIHSLPEVEKARICYEFVRDAIGHSWDDQTSTVTLTASEVAAHKTGICYAKANLLAALLRK